MDTFSVILIAAIGKNRELGKRGDLVWRISDDLKRFKEQTSGYPIIMGRKTFDSIGRPLLKRVNIIVTRNEDYRQEGCVVVHSVEQALETAKNTGAEKVFVIGGAELYKAALPFATELDLTLVDAQDSQADVFFPEFEDAFTETDREEKETEDGLKYAWVTYKEKIPK